MHIEQNFFQLFDVEESFYVDLQHVSERYRSLQKEVHPDRFAQASDREQLLAVQYAAHINEGHDTLKSPLKRAHYLLKVKGRELTPEPNTGRLDPMFLIQQMELRERLESVSDCDEPETEIDDLRQDTEQSWQALVDIYVGAMKEAGESGLDAAENTFRKMQFLDKLRREIEVAEDELTDY